MTVDLPAPVSPGRPRPSPARSASETSQSASIGPKDRVVMRFMAFSCHLPFTGGFETWVSGADDPNRRAPFTVGAWHGGLKCPDP